MGGKAKVYGACSCFLAAGFVYFGNLADELSLYLTSAFLVLSAVFLALPKRKKKEPIVLKLAGLTWTQEQFNHNFFLSGGVGSGKTSAIDVILDQILSRVNNVGICWCEAKGSSYGRLIAALERHKRLDDLVILEVPFNGRRAHPVQRMNLVTAGNLGPDIVAQILADIAERGRQSEGKSATFFRKQLIMHVSAGIRFLQDPRINLPPTMAFLHTFLCNQSQMERLLKLIGGTYEKPKGRDGKVIEDAPEQWVPGKDPITNHWVHEYLLQPPEQQGGVVSSIVNALSPFISDHVAEVFSSSEPDTVNFGDIEKGKIFCLVCPSSYPEEKEALTQYFKSLFFQIINRRYDLKKFEPNRVNNPLVLFADEYQLIASPTDSRPLSIIREANGSCVASCQDRLSLVPVLGDAIAKVVLGKFRNLLLFASESPASAEESAATIGKRWVWRYSYGSSGGKGSSNKSRVEEFILPSQHFMRMRNHFCCIRHTCGKIRRKVKLKLPKKLP